MPYQKSSSGFKFAQTAIMAYMEQMCTRILHLDLNSDCPDRDVVLDLMNLMAEYIRRMAVSCSPLNVPPSRPFFDLAEIINPDIRADEVTLSKVRHHLSTSKNVWTPRVCEWAIHFAALQDAMIQQHEMVMESPYEALIVIYEQGGDFTVKSEISICGGTVFMSNWRDQTSPTPIVDLAKFSTDR
jgi:hypothetical protein